MNAWKMGVVRIHYGVGVKLGYGANHGFGRGWLPMLVQHSMVMVWNRIACLIWGHDELDYERLTGEDRVVCVNCGAHLRGLDRE